MIAPSLRLTMMSCALKWMWQSQAIDFSLPKRLPWKARTWIQGENLCRS